MRFTIDAAAVDGHGSTVLTLTSGVRSALEGTSRGAQATNPVAESMPASQAARSGDVIHDLHVHLLTAIAALEDFGGRVRLAAEQYATADRVVAAADAAGAPGER